MSLNYEMKSNLNDKAVDEFLNSQTKEGTFKSYKTVMKQYLQYTQKTGQELLDIKKADTTFQVENSMLNYRKHILSKGKSENYAVGSIMTIRGFYAYYRMPLMFRKQESRKLGEKNRTTTDYLFDKEDLAKMALAGNLKERYVLLVGKSIGLRASDFLSLTYGQLRSLKLENEAPIALGEIATKKERIRAFPFLDSDAIPIVKAWLDSHKEPKDSDKILDDTEDNLSVILQTLAKKSGMEIENGAVHGKRVRFHCMRKFLIDRLSAYAGESQWKQIVGKSIDEGAYVSQDQLRGIFLRAMPTLLIDGNGFKAKKLEELENALRAVESENGISKTRIDMMQKTVDEQNIKFDRLLGNWESLFKGTKDIIQDQKRTITELLTEDYPITISVIDSETGKRTIETINTPEELKRFREDLRKRQESEIHAH